MVLKNNLGFLLRRNGITLSIFAKRMEISYAKAGTYVRGEAKMSIDTLISISEKFNVSCDDLLKKDLSSAKHLADHIGIYGKLKEVVLQVDNHNIVNEEKETYQVPHYYKEKYLQVLEENRELHNERANLLKQVGRLKKDNIINH